MKIFNICLCDVDGNVLNWFESYDNIITGRFVEKINSKVFMKLDHAKNCVEQFMKTSKNNKSKTHENKLEEFKEKFPYSTFVVIETEVENVIHYIGINIDRTIVYLKELDKDNSQYKFTKNVEDAFQYTDYEMLKLDCKYCFEKKYFTNSKTEILTKIVW